MAFKTLLVLPLLLCGASTEQKGQINPNTKVAEITIFAYHAIPSKSNVIGALTGHCFIQVENITDSYLTVGCIGLYGYNSVTISCWPSMDSFNHDGIWFNRETYNQNGWQVLPNYSISTQITQTKLAYLTSYLNDSSNNYYDLTHTCANAAVEMWNTVAPSSLELNPLIPDSPLAVMLSIGLLSGSVYNASFTTGTYCGYVGTSSNYVPYC